ncbi:hypothetical protein [Zunongwangia sp. H14]|uniref:hypothetical protein n=1 Tax=Zunongwangia sp. H14 TaxID=3240792 RepID=UPI0035692E61
MLKNIDPALKRKGRLKLAYEFKPLPKEKANILVREEGLEFNATEAMTLAEIFNITEEHNHKEPGPKAVGFR